MVNTLNKQLKREKIINKARMTKEKELEGNIVVLGAKPGESNNVKNLLESMDTKIKI
jgi:hypothetical protein